MRRLGSLVVAVALTTVPAVASDTEAAVIKESFEAGVAALNAGNVEGFLANIHDRALSFYACGPTSGKEGKEACQLDWERFFGKTAAAKFEPRNMQYRVIGDTGIAWGEYEVSVHTRNGQELNHQGRYTLTYAKHDGEWKVIMQHNTPAEQGPAGPRERAQQSATSSP